MSAVQNNDAISLSFDWSDHGDEDHAEDVVQIR
jgi:hypothetical protein